MSRRSFTIPPFIDKRLRGPEDLLSSERWTKLVAGLQDCRDRAAAYAFKDAHRYVEINLRVGAAGSVSAKTGFRRRGLQAFG
jgi:hypothetical protein